MSEIISAQVEMRELTENVWFSRQMCETWHVWICQWSRIQKEEGTEHPL